MKPLEEMGKFKTVVVDPPWDIEFGFDDLTNKQQSEKAHREHEIGDRQKTPGYAVLNYETLSTDEIKRLAISSVLERDALVLLWTTMRRLPEAFEIVREWGLDYHYTMTWVKSWGPKAIGRPMYNSEFAIAASNGRPDYLSERMFFVANCWNNPRQHSVKPEEFYDLLRRVTPGPRLDVFGRRPIAGFQSWGNEAPDGPAPAGHFQDVMDV